MNPRQALTPEEQLAKDLSAMTDSVNLINQLIEAQASTEAELDTIRRNYQHLQIMIGRKSIAATDTLVYEACIQAAITYLGE